MTTNRGEKERRVIELYKQGKTIRDTAKELHMSFGNISSIIKKENGVEENKKKSLESQAFQLFLEHKQLVDVAITLDIRADKVEALYIEFCRLKGFDDLILAYDGIKHCVPDLLQLYATMKMYNMETKDIVNALKYTRELPYIESTYDGLINANQILEDKKKNSRGELLALKNEILKSKNSLRYYQSSLKDKRKKIAAMDKKIVQLNAVIDRTQNDNEEHQKMEEKE
jgi:hypothetical protein